jgi:hypothetical protein
MSAGRWSLGAGLIFVAAILTGTGSAICLISADSAAAPLCGLAVAGGLAALALWFHLIAQLIHIRALLAR